jgi:hypothetical protein
MDLPLYIKDDFRYFYRDMFKRAVEKENMSTLGLEYARDMGWCDPCAADPMSNEEMQKLGVDRLQNSRASFQVTSIQKRKTWRS